MKIKVDKKQEDKLLRSLSECIGFRSVNVSVEFTQAVIQYTFGKTDTITSEDDSLEAEVFSLKEYLKDTFDHVCENAVDARIYAFENISDGYRRYLKLANDHQEMNNKPTDEIFEDISDLSGNYVFDKSEIAKPIASKLNSLTIDCSQFLTDDPSRQGLDRLSLGGSYNRKTNTLIIHPGSLAFSLTEYHASPDPKYLLNSKRDAIISVAVHSFLHELVHICEPCMLEQKIGTEDSKQLQGMLVEQWAMQFGLSPNEVERIFDGNLQDPTNKLDSLKRSLFEINKSRHTAYGHCTRFKLALLYLSRSNKNVMFIRDRFVSEIERLILEEQTLVEHPQGFGSRFPQGQSGAESYAYDWETKVTSAYMESIDQGEISFTPQSEVVDTDDLLISLKKASRKFTRHNPYAEAFDDVSVSTNQDLFYSIDGETNLFRFEYEGDAFDKMTLILNHSELIPSSEAIISLGEPFLGMYARPDYTAFMYSDNGERFTEVTIEEAWWLLTL
jgi:hypothetical protein